MSDLHLEVSRWDLPPKEQHPDSDVLIVAGDVTTKAERGVEWLRDRVRDRPIVYCMGNHELYNQDADKSLQKARLAARGSNVTVLNDDYMSFGGYEIIGATMWTDFGLFGPEFIRRCMDCARDRMNDYRKIRVNDYARRFTPEDALVRHMRTIKFLNHRVHDAPNSRRIVVTHHSPEPIDVGEDLIAAAYCSAVDPALIAALKCELWVSGHVHMSRDHVAGGTRFAGNPKGYGPFNGEKIAAWENPEFDPYKVVSVGP
ncbi:hypothetical protein BST63_27400 [Bradyrhizobium canariense]|uniref:Calcineurin-like phosphoesterase domain-containing protein n=1 Tax=Bradyrhizobium canariense TaxID=255045 RepID=A0ABX3WY25_9BRAD|nr:metallophosphoesterase [Bradyrhizobium canariense]OSJ08874.1 hypothetical protein BSR47_35770 [Bradyrhizobium canariense]OSJ24267.1 hypothetical protein BST63_27400 [Bradyrhizobium canariense]